MGRNFALVRGVIVSVACLVIGIFQLLPYLPQWAWIALGAVGLVVDAVYFVVSRRRAQTTPGATPADGDRAS